MGLWGVDVTLASCNTAGKVASAACIDCGCNILSLHHLRSIQLIHAEDCFQKVICAEAWNRADMLANGRQHDNDAKAVLRYM